MGPKEEDNKHYQTMHRVAFFFFWPGINQNEIILNQNIMFWLERTVSFK
jgi:hypothetical protein